MSGTHCILVIEGLMRAPLESLGLSRLDQGERYVSLRWRIMLPALASLFFACAAFAGASYGSLTAEATAATPGVLPPGWFGETAFICLAVMGWGGWLSWKIATDTVFRLRRLSAGMEALSSGKADLSSRLEIARNDDIGRMTSAFNGFLDLMPPWCPGSRPSPRPPGTRAANWLRTRNVPGQTSIP
jgi:methyl-accepting chemotaxis protein